MLVRMMQKGVRLASAPDGHDERVGDELGVHLRLHRPADNTPREKVDNRSHVEPAFSCPDIGEVGNPFAVGLVRRELAIEHIWRDRGGEPKAVVLLQATPARSCPEGLCLHQPLDPVQAAKDAFGQHIAPDTPSAVGSGAADEARPHLRADLFVVADPLARRPIEPSVEPRP